MFQPSILLYCAAVNAGTERGIEQKSAVTEITRAMGGIDESIQQNSAEAARLHGQSERIRGLQRP